jgi:phosphoribosylformylglycinamidine (FGAM) synthase-like enzyme
VRANVLSSAHDIAEGGLAIALAECCLAGGIGANVELGELADRAAEALFGEGPGGFVVSATGVALDELALDVPLHRLGTVGGDSLTLGVGVGVGVGVASERVRVSLDELARAHAGLAELFS